MSAFDDERSVAVLKKGNIVITTAFLGGILHELIINISNTKYYEDQTKAGNDVPHDGEETAKVDSFIVDCPDLLKPSSPFRVMQFDRRVQRYQDWQNQGTHTTCSSIERWFPQENTSTQLIESCTVQSESSV